jgi:hypothetical protein
VPISGVVTVGVFGDTDGKFPVKTTNALGHSETKTFDAKTGNVFVVVPSALVSLACLPSASYSQVVVCYWSTYQHH